MYRTLKLIRHVLVMVLAATAGLAGGPLAAQDGSLDTGFNPGSGPNTGVQFLAVQPDGRTLIGGNFTSVAGTPINRIARLNADGTRDTGFTPGTGANGYTRMTVQPDGKIILVGGFTTVNGVARNRIARLNADGSLDTTFDPGTGADNAVYHAIVQPDARIIVVGLYTSINGVARNRVARLNADGSVDTTFDPGTGANGAINFGLLQPDGKLVIGGLFTSYNGASRERIARVNPDGSLDTAFAAAGGCDNSVFWIDRQSDGKLLIAGGFGHIATVARAGIARLNADGSVDTTFDPGTGANNTVFTLGCQPDGKVVIAGNFTDVNGIAINRIARLNADGTFDSTFNPGTGANQLIQALVIQPDGKIVLGGSFTNVNGTSRNYVARLNNPSIAIVPPAIISTAPSFAVVGQPFAYTLTGTGNPSPTFSFSGLPGWLVFDNVDTIAGTPGPADLGMSGVITATASNAGGTDDQLFQIDVQGIPPVITTPSLQPATIGVAYSFHVAATGTPAPAFSSSGLPAWLTLNPSTGELTGTPGSGDLGLSAPFDIIADNGWLPNDVAPFQIQVNGVAPVITSPPPTDATVGVLYTYTIVATGDPAPNFSISGEPAWLLLAGNVLSGTPPGSAVGVTGPITIAAQNGSTPDDTQTFLIDVFGQSPTFTTTPVLTATPGSPYAYTAAATGTPAPTLSITSALPAWLSFDDTTGELTGTPTNGDARTSVNITLLATNSVSPDATQTFVIEVGRSPDAQRSAGDGDGCAAAAANWGPVLALLPALFALLVASRRRRHP